VEVRLEGPFFQVKRPDSNEPVYDIYDGDSLIGQVGHSFLPQFLSNNPDVRISLDPKLAEKLRKEAV